MKTPTLSPLPVLDTPKTGKTYKRKSGYTSQKLEPIYIRKLYEMYKKKNDVAALLKVSSPTINAALAQGSVYAPIELAAQGIYEIDLLKQQANKPSEKVFVSMSMDRATLDVLTPWLEQAGINFKTL